MRNFIIFLSFIILLFMPLVGAVLLYILSLLKLIRTFLKKKRIEKLMAKYNNRTIVAKILNKSIWVDQTYEQLLDSIGSPEHISEWTSKSKKGETWKYGQTGKNRYNLKIDLVNDRVTGWTIK